MKYVSIDLETTGLDPNNCQILEFGAVIDDCCSPLDKLPTFHCYIKADEYQGEPYALSMHAKIFRRIAENESGFRYLNIGTLAYKFYYFLHDNGLDDHITVAGKNFASFDWRFLHRAPGWDHLIKIRSRVIDPGCLYWDPILDGERLPNLKTCFERASFTKSVAHTALEDAGDVVLLIRSYLKRKNNVLDPS